MERARELVKETLSLLRATIWDVDRSRVEGPSGEHLRDNAMSLYHKWIKEFTPEELYLFLVEHGGGERTWVVALSQDDAEDLCDYTYDYDADVNKVSQYHPDYQLTITCEDSPAAEKSATGQERRTLTALEWIKEEGYGVIGSTVV